MGILTNYQLLSYSYASWPMVRFPSRAFEAPNAVEDGDGLGIEADLTFKTRGGLGVDFKRIGRGDNAGKRKH